MTSRLPGAPALLYNILPQYQPQRASGHDALANQDPPKISLNPRHRNPVQYKPNPHTQPQHIQQKRGSRLPQPIQNTVQRGGEIEERADPAQSHNKCPCQRIPKQRTPHPVSQDQENKSTP